MKLKLAVAADVSGSVNDEQLGQFFSEVDALKNLGIDIVLIQCDTAIRKVEAYDGQKVEVGGRGGTLFAPVFDLLNSNDFQQEHGNVDGLIYLTDGDNFDDPSTVQEPSFEVLWALLEGCSSKYDWGYKTEVVVRKAV